MLNNIVSVRVHTAFYQSKNNPHKIMKKFFVGIDFSKRRMDVSIVERESPEQAMAYNQFANNAEGANIRRIQAQSMMVRCCSVASTQALIAWRFVIISVKMADTFGWAILWISSAAWDLSEERMTE